ncbi:GntR family transcriptional regulator [Streptomyces sp. NPDC013457]|uniref:GntR family transcriptional regulator n=1 Tax=Streptomyces sp. NPDC013457 TaxID=3364866 RepID=UPI0036F872FB
MGHLKQSRLITARERLRDQVAHALRAALISGELKPGAVYSAPGLAEDFGVSATPVREAMLDLAREGLVEPVRNKGFRVTEVDERDLDQYTDIRLLIEVPTVGRVTLTLSGNARLVETVGELRKRSRLYGLTALDERGELLPSAEEHLELLDLMLAGDVRGAEECMVRHLSHVRSLWAARDEADARGAADADARVGRPRVGL